MKLKHSAINLVYIKKIYKENFTELQNIFNKFQSFFLNDLYERYDKDLDCAIISLYYEKNLHQTILRSRDYNFDFDLSFNKFWDNHSSTKQDLFKIINISKSTGLPKETVRRKVKILLDNKVLELDKKKIFWKPQQDKEFYTKTIDKHLDVLLKFSSSISKFLNQSFDIKITKEKILKNFSFYRFHYLNAQLKFLKIWQLKFKDLELLMLYLECEIQSNLFINNKVSKPFLSATTVSNITGLPKSTVIRKLSKLSRMKIIKKELLSDKYKKKTEGFFFNNNFNLNNISNEAVDNFSEFYFIVLKALSR